MKSSVQDANAPLALLRLAESDPPPSGAHILAVITHGSGDAGSHAWPIVESGLRALGDASVDFLRCTETPRTWSENGIRFAGTSQVAFATFSVPGATHLAATTERWYGALLAGLAAGGYPFVLRVWNAIPDINVAQDGLERYRQFSVGRASAFRAAAQFGGGQYPASTAIGCRGERFIAYAIASREPGIHFENPQQVPAHQYPDRYGPQSPRFCRAVGKSWGSSATLFVSGTASITGHESRYSNDIRAQTQQTLENLEAVIAVAGERMKRSFRLNSPGAITTAYLRNPEDEEIVRQILADRLGDARVQLARADICRSELLVEIDSVVFA